MVIIDKNMLRLQMLSRSFGRRKQISRGRVRLVRRHDDMSGKGMIQVDLFYLGMIQKMKEGMRMFSQCE